MTWRSASRRDLDGIRTLVAAVGAEFGFDPEPKGADLDLYGEAEAYFADSALLEVMELDGDLVGVLGILPVGPPKAATWELRKLYLAAAFRAQGHGRRAAQRAIRFAAQRGAKKLILQSSYQLTAALALYRSLGFVEVEASPHSSTCDVAMELVDPSGEG